VACHIENMDTYSIETDSDGGFRVRAVRSTDGRSEIVAEFPTESEARAWMDNQIQIDLRAANASDVA